MFVVGSGVDVSSVKAHLEHLVSCRSMHPMNPELALARGAALASAARRPSRRHGRPGLLPGPDGTTAGNAYAALAAADTQLAPVGSDDDGATDRHRADCCRRGSQAVPARR